MLANLLYRSTIEYAALPALKIGDLEITYEELGRRAMSVAAFLSDTGVRNENIGIFTQRNYSAYAGVLGSICAGCAYVPINPRYPHDKIRDIISDAGIRILIGSADDWNAINEVFVDTGKIEYIIIPEGSIERIPGITVINGDELTRYKVAANAAPSESSPDDNAYIMFTSGSTGKPKGVQVTNRNVVSFLENMKRFYKLEPGYRASQTFDLSFDLSVCDMFFTWINGGTLCVLTERDMYCPSEYIRDKGIEFWFSVPTLAGFMKKLDALTPNVFPALKYSLFCGEPMTQQLADAWLLAAPNSAVDNLYGPTETTVSITRYSYTPEDGKRRYYNGIVPIGTPYDAQTVVLVDDKNNRIAGSDIGEVVIQGSQVTKGYLNDPENTSRAYVKMPWDDEGAVWYKTGDLAFYNDKNELEYVARKDKQIKLGGRRVELGEIESCLRRYLKTEDVVVVPQRDENDIVQGLVAYVSTKLSTDELRKMKQETKEGLENIFFPRQFIFLEEFPTTVSGKIDRVILENNLPEYMNQC